MNRHGYSRQTELDFFASAEVPSAPPLAVAAPWTPAAPAWDGSCGELRAVRVGESIARADAGSASLAADYWRSNISRAPWFAPEREMLVVLLLDTRHRAFGFSLIAIGSLNEAVAHPREIMRPVIATPAFGFILFHNHPSGVTEPSEADKRMTHRIKQCADLFTVRLHDHLIMPTGGTAEERAGFFSFRENGLL